VVEVVLDEEGDDDDDGGVVVEEVSEEMPVLWVVCVPVCVVVVEERELV
jgi:hypothetical protein